MAEFGNGLTEESLLDSDPGHPELEDPGVGDEEPGLEEGEAAIEDPELEAIKARVREMEEEAEKLKELQNEVEKQMNLSPPPVGPVIMSIEEKMEADGRSIYVGNWSYGATAEEVRAIILIGGHWLCFLFAYIEFADKESVRTAMALDESLFRGRQIKNKQPAVSTTDRGLPRARFRSRGGSFTSRARYYSGYTPPEAEDGPSGRSRAVCWP
uniref:Poly(A) binding protein, nuclear 1 n=1 Tax=Salarias fasciatus TaxID=181472 RepID=A0A672H1Q1_SALFA